MYKNVILGYWVWTDVGEGQFYALKNIYNPKYAESEGSALFPFYLKH